VFLFFPTLTAGNHSGTTLLVNYCVQSFTHSCDLSSLSRDLEWAIVLQCRVFVGLEAPLLLGLFAPVSNSAISFYTFPILFLVRIEHLF
jgi:hypothetical protein